MLAPEMSETKGVLFPFRTFSFSILEYEDYGHPLSTLYRGHPQMVILEGLLEQSSDMAKNMNSKVMSLCRPTQEQRKIIYGRCDLFKDFNWEFRELLEVTNACLLNDTLHLKKLCADLSAWFEFPMQKANRLLEAISSGIYVNIIWIKNSTIQFLAETYSMGWKWIL